MVPSPLEVENPLLLVWAYSASFTFDLNGKAVVAVAWLIEDNVGDALAIPRTFDLLGLRDAHAGATYGSAEQDVGH